MKRMGEKRGKEKRKGEVDDDFYEKRVQKRERESGEKRSTTLIIGNNLVGSE